MPAKPPASGVAKVTFNFLCSGRTFGDSIYIGHVDSVPWTAAQLLTLATGASTEWGAHMAPITSPLCVLESVSTLDLSDDVGRSGLDTTVRPGTGTGTEPLPLNSVAHISFEVARRYRGGRSGFNVSGLDRNMMADDRLFNSSDANVILNAVNALISNTLLFLTDVQHVGVSYVANKVPRLVPLVLPIIEAEIQQRLCTLRKRLGKGV